MAGAVKAGIRQAKSDLSWSQTSRRRRAIFRLREDSEWDTGATAHCGMVGMARR